MKPRHSSEVTRRTIVKTALASPVAAQTRAPGGGDNSVQSENRKPGATDWQLTNVRLVKTAGFRSRVMEGYCSHQSIEAGDTLRIMASADPPGRFRVEIFRMGYYGGAGARRMTVLGPFDGKTQPDPPVGPNRLRESLSSIPNLQIQRSPLPSEVAKYASAVERRLLVKPGITGLWQVSGRSDLSWEDSVRLDLYYVENWSLSLDLSILARTAYAVVKPQGAY